MTDDKIVDIRPHLENNPQAQNYEGESALIQCPYCKGVEWAVQTDEKSSLISYLICISEECDGGSYIEVEEGFPEEEVFHFEPESPE